MPPSFAARSWRAASRYAWLVPAAYGLLLVVAGLLWLLTGAPFDRATYARLLGESWSGFVVSQPPAVTHLLSTNFRLVGGNTATLAGGLLLAIAITSYRTGQWWAWFVVWLLPLHSGLDLFLVWSAGALTAHALAWDSLLIALTLTAQWAARPRDSLATSSGLGAES